jgi:3-oxoacyl-(acyl-carrier-protein) synthase
MSEQAERQDRDRRLGELLAMLLERGEATLRGGRPAGAAHDQGRDAAPAGDHTAPARPEPVVITGAALGLPVDQFFDNANVGRILAGEQLIRPVPQWLREEMADRRVRRLVKREGASPTFETIDTDKGVIKLAGRRGPLNVVDQFGVEPDRVGALDSCTRMAIGVGIDALRDAGIPLVRHYRTTTLGTKLPDRWGLPVEVRDDMGVVFGCSFPGFDAFARDCERYFADRANRRELATLTELRAQLDAGHPAAAELDRRIAALHERVAADGYQLDRQYFFRVLSMGHSQLAEVIGARGPNTQVNSACASTTQALCVAQDWIRSGRCRRVLVVGADDLTSDALMPWLGSGFLATGAAATDDVVEDAATPFDRRRHGLIMGVGAAALVVESAQAARERGVRPICEVLAAVAANSAFHGTRLNVEHIRDVMERVVEQAEGAGVDREAIAARTVFLSHETYTPARGGSAAAEIHALRRVFGPACERVVIANTKCLTGHTMAAGLEDVVAVKALETGIVPPVVNCLEPDEELGVLNLSRGGSYPVEYALRLAAGFGSQIGIVLMRRIPSMDGRRPRPDELGYEYRIDDGAAWHDWLTRISANPDPLLEVVQRRLRVVEVSNVEHNLRPASTGM